MQIIAVESADKISDSFRILQPKAVGLGTKGNTAGAIATSIAVIVQVVVSAIVNKKN